MIRAASLPMSTRLMYGVIVIFTCLIPSGCSVWRDFLPGDSESRTVENRSAAADGFVWYDDWDQAIKLAEQTNRPLLVNFTGSDWCIWCQRLEDEVFSQPDFASWASPRFVGVRLDYPQSRSLPDEVAAQNAQLRQQYSDLVKAFPTVLVVSPSGEVVGKLGYVQGGPDAWIARLESEIAARR